MNDIANTFSQMEEEKGAYNVKVGENTYTLYALHTSVGYSVALKIVSLILPSAAAGTDGFINSEAFGDSQTFSDASLFLVKQLAEIDTLAIVKVLLNEAKCNGKEIDFETHFRSQYGILAELIEAALRENFTSFFTHMGMKEKLLNSLISILDLKSTPLQQESED